MSMSTEHTCIMQHQLYPVDELRIVLNPLQPSLSDTLP